MKQLINLNRKHMARLFQGVGVEVGVAEGRYSKIILENKNVTKLYGVDPFLSHKEYKDYTKPATFERLYASTRERLMPYANRWELLRMFSMDAVKAFEDEHFDFVYIDANHDYKHVTEDITEWIKKVKPGGIIAGDDYRVVGDRGDRYEVVRAVDDYAEAHGIDVIVFAEGRSPNNWLWVK